jgi:hypothetical protein
MAEYAGHVRDREVVNPKNCPHACEPPRVSRDSIQPARRKMSETWTGVHAPPSRMNAPNSTSCADAEVATTDTVGKPDINVGLEQAQERKSPPAKKSN